MKKVCSKLFIAIIVLIAIFNNNTIQAAPTSSNTNWNILMENIEIKDGSVAAKTNPTINESLTGVFYEVDLDTPGQYFEFTVDVKNSGSIDAMIDEVGTTTLTTEQQKYLVYSVTYDNGKNIEKNDKLNSGATKKIKVRIEFKKDINAEDLPNSDTGIEFELNLNYIQADKNAQDVDDIIDRQEKNIYNNEKEIKTGDIILTYLLLGSLSMIALIIAIRKSK